MADVITADKPIKRTKFERKFSIESESSNDKTESGTTQLETKRSCKPHHQYHLIVEDLIVNYKYPSEEVKTHLKRKLPIDAHWEDLLQPRKFKLHHNPVAINMYESENDASSMEHGNGGIVTPEVPPHWNIIEEENSQQSSSEVDIDDTLSLEGTDVQIVTIDEMIEYEGSESEIDEAPIRFQIHKLCTIVEEEETNREGATDDEEKKTQDMLPFTNNSPVVTYDVEKDFISKTINEAVEHIERFCPLVKCNKCLNVEMYKEQWQNDGQIEKFNFARCFKCGQKVYGMHGCPRSKRW